MQDTNFKETDFSETRGDSLAVKRLQSERTPVLQGHGDILELFHYLLGS